MGRLSLVQDKTKTAIPCDVPDCPVQRASLYAEHVGRGMLYWRLCDEHVNDPEALERASRYRFPRKPPEPT